MAQSPVTLTARTLAPDRYLAALLAPSQAQAGLIALAALQAELGQIPDAVREPMAGEIRLQWWRDTVLAGVQTEASALSGHPVADAVTAAMRRHNLPIGLILGQIDAVAALLDAEPFADEGALRSHLAKTAGAQFALAARVLGVGHDARIEAAALAAGASYGLARTLYALPAELAQGRHMLPATVLAASGVAPGDLQLVQGPPLVRAALIDSLDRLAGACTARQAEAIALVSALPKRVRPAFLPMALTSMYVRLSRAVPDRLRQQRPIPALERQWRLWRAHSFGGFA
jgi:15-cis-phytoene synthase